MKRFSNLFSALDETTKTNRKIAALVGYLKSAPAEDAIWAIRFLTGRKPRQIIPTRKLREWAADLAGIPDWLFEASYDAVGDLAETIALLLPRAIQTSTRSLHEWVEQRLLPLRDKPEWKQQSELISAWQEMSTSQRFVWNKLITGGFRVGVSQRLVTRALSQFSGLDTAVIAHRLMGQWEATPEFYQQLLSSETRDTDISRPYPFFLAHPLGDPPEKLGDMRQWESEWKWDGIRAQVIKRQGKVFIWSRGEELVTDKYPELVKPLDRLPDGSVLDGEILPWQKDRPLIFAELQRRIGRKNITKKILREVPAVLMAYDLLEYDGKDIRTEPLYRRKQVLASLIASAADPTLKLSPGLNVNDWQALAGKREDARRYGVEGLMLKRLDSPYHVGRRRGDWWKWKLDPLQVDAVLVYAQRGHGRRSGLYTDYTFAVWNEDSLVPIAKAYSGLTDREIRQVDRFIRQNTREQFGPVRSVTPALVFEIAFEDIWISKRHKSGIAVRFPRISRWRHDKPIEEADTLTSVKALLNAKSIIDPMGGND